MSGLATFFGRNESYDASLIALTTTAAGRASDESDNDDAERPPSREEMTSDHGEDQDFVPPAKQSATQVLQASYKNHRVQLKLKTLQYMRWRIYGDEVHAHVPHIGQAISSAKDIAALNLHVQQFNLSLCRIDKVWPLRSCKRGRHMKTERRHWQFDGPVSTIYRSVLSFEVLQCFDQPPSELTQRIRNLHGMDQHSHRCRVFLYNGYATAFMSFLEASSSSLRHNNNKVAGKQASQVYCSLRHIPARCIFRYKSNDWVDAHEKFCLVIGDNSAVERAGQHESFDSEDLIIELLRVASSPSSSTNNNNNQVLSEFQIRRLDDETITLEKTTDSRLLSIYKAYVAKDDSTTATPIGSGDGAASGSGQNAGDETGPEPSNEEVNRQSTATLAELPVLLETAELIDASGGFGARAPRRVTVAAVALSFNQPYRSARGDWTMSITVIDDSLQLCDNVGTTTTTTNSNNNNPLFIKSHSVNIFVGPKMGCLLPKLRESGDVVLLRNVELKTFNGEIQLQGNKLGNATYACYRRRDNKAVIDTDVFTNAEARRVDELWTWGQRRLRLHATMKQEHRFRICDMLPRNNTLAQRNACGKVEPANRGDMFALITAIIPWDNDSVQPPKFKPKGFLRVWDGTGVSTSDKLPLETPAALQVLEDGDPSDRAVLSVANVVRKLRADSPGKPSLKIPAALAGRVVNVAIWEPQHWQLVTNEHLKVGLFIRMRNIMESMSEQLLGIRCLNVQNKSSFTITPPLTYEVVKLVEDHNQRLLNGEPTNPLSWVLPLGMDEDDDVVATAPRRGKPNESSVQIPKPSRLLKGSSLRMESLQKFASAPHGSIFHGIVRLKDIFPPIEQAREDGLQVFCRRQLDAGPKPFFQFSLRVEQEGSATVLDALVSDKKKKSPIGPLVFSSSAEDAIKDTSRALVKLQENLVSKQRWKALIKSKFVNGNIFFVLSSLEMLD